MFCIYCLAKNQDIQERLFIELSTLIDSQHQIGYDSVRQLPYLTAVVEETLRLFNPVLRMERRAANDFPLGDEKGTIITKGMIVGIPVWAMHHCEEFPQPK
eukprot:Lithocolla_globosa_v1_NODE_5616_length_1210_cov_3.591342.p3 type:complete len:101 gc:universal NODE_5616_length_1210_cov_3.591342:545-243(-)